MIRLYTVTREMLNQAREEADRMGKLNSSITDGQGNLAGFVGEIVVHSVLGGERLNTFDYDLVTPNKLLCDVKSKRCTSTPRPNFEASIADFNIRQKCQYYIFTRVLQTYNKCWIAGFIEKEQYFQKATFYKKGDIDPNDSRGFDFKADCYNLRYSELIDIHEFPGFVPKVDLGGSTPFIPMEEDERLKMIFGDTDETF